MSRVSVRVDGVAYADEVEPRLLLVHYLRDRWARRHADRLRHLNCGACTVLLRTVGPGAS